MVVNAPLAVQATKQSALQGLYFDEDLTKQLRAAVRELRQAAADGADPAAVAAILETLGRELRSPFEKESKLSGAIFRTDDAKEGPQRVRGEASAGLAGPVIDPATDPRSPCIIGVAARTWHPADVGDAGAPEPLEMWEEVARAAAADATRPGLLEQLDSLQIVYCQTWQYDDAVARLAARLGAEPRHRHYSGIGGTTTQQLVASTAERMLDGELDLALITSAEALATQRVFRKRGERYPYSFQPAEKRPFPWEARPDPVEVAHEVFEAWLTFAIFDNARRARLGVALDEYRDGMGRMLAPMNAVAAANPHAWFPTPRTAAEIVAVRADNRMVGYPYTKYMVAVMDVDMAAALVVATHERADALGVPADRRVYLRGWGGANDPVAVAAHPDLTSSPAMRVASAQALAGAARVSTTSRTSTSTRASRARCTSRSTRSASTRRMRAA